MTRRLLHHGFCDSADRFPDRPALEVSGQLVTYAELRLRAESIAAGLMHLCDTAPLVAIFGHRCPTAYAGLLGIMMAGRGYVPISPQHPSTRIGYVLDTAACRTMVVASDAEPMLEQTTAMAEPMTLILPMADALTLARWRDLLPQHEFIGAEALTAARSYCAPDTSDDDTAYVLFTSGSTGTPKGVTIRHCNIRHFVDAMVDRYEVNETDRFSQVFDLTFDASMFDLYVAWEVGACLCCPRQFELMIPGRFLQDARITRTLLVPSMGLLIQRQRMLEPGTFPDLRLSLFVGEALPQHLAEQWAEAAPNGPLENLYGPTEVSDACTVYSWKSEESPAECLHGIVPIGEVFEGLEARVVDEHLQPVDPDKEGELIIHGPQVAAGYWADEAQTDRAFVTLKDGRVFYRTGDRVRNSTPLQFLGRIDHQIKLRGYRVELEEVEAALRKVCDAPEAVVLGWPTGSNGPESLVAFVQCAKQIDLATVKQKLVEQLPAYMVPRRIIATDSFPLNANGKVDRKALLAQLD